MATKIKRPKIKKIKSVALKKPKKITKRDSTAIGSSNIEKLFGAWLEKLGIIVEEQFNIGYRYYDFKVKEKNILIEFHGSYWHGDENVYEAKDLNAVQKKNKKNDIFKKQLAKANGFELIEVWENDFKSNPKKVADFLIEKIIKNAR